MKKKELIFLALSVLFSLFLTSEVCLPQAIPLPEGIEIITPSSDLLKEIAAFSGKWEGVWENVLDAILIVEEIDSEQAKVIYAWGDAPRWNITKGYSRGVAKVIPGSRPKIEWGEGVNRPKFVFKMNKNLKELWGTRDFKGSSATVIMKKKAL